MKFPEPGYSAVKTCCATRISPWAKLPNVAGFHPPPIFAASSNAAQNRPQTFTEWHEGNAVGRETRRINFTNSLGMIQDRNPKGVCRHRQKPVLRQWHCGHVGMRPEKPDPGASKSWPVFRLPHCHVGILPCRHPAHVGTVPAHGFSCSPGGVKFKFSSRHFPPCKSSAGSRFPFSSRHIFHSVN